MPVLCVRYWYRPMFDCTIYIYWYVQLLASIMPILFSQCWIALLHITYMPYCARCTYRRTKSKISKIICHVRCLLCVNVYKFCKVINIPHIADIRPHISAVFLSQIFFILLVAYALRVRKIPMSKHITVYWWEIYWHSAKGTQREEIAGYHGASRLLFPKKHKNHLVWT